MDFAKQNYDMQEKMKMHARQTEGIGCLDVGAAACGPNLAGLSPARPCLSDRVRDQLNAAYRDAWKVERLNELDALLLKHPDVARILDLMEIVRG